MNMTIWKGCNPVSEVGRIVSRRSLLISSAFAVLVLGSMTRDASAIPLPVYPARLVLGQIDFNSNVAATSSRGENGPSAVGFDVAGSLWVSDQCNSRILKFERPFYYDMQAAVVIGQPDFTTTNSPGVCFPDGGLPPQPPTTRNAFFYVDKFSFDAAGNLWAADGGNNRVLEFSPPFSTGMSPSLVIGQTDFTSSVPATSINGLNFPTEPVFDAAGNLWVADIGNNRVLKYVPPFRTGMSASLVIGQTDFNSSACVTTQSGFCSADGIQFDGFGNLWVADAFGNNRIVQFRPPFRNGMNASLVIGQQDFVSNTPSAGRQGLDFSDGVGFSFDAGGNMWVGDTRNNRVLEFARPFTTGMGALRVLGQPDFTTSAPATTRSGLWIPVRPAFDSAGHLWVPDANNNRILEYGVMKSPAP